MGQKVGALTCHKAENLYGTNSLHRFRLVDLNNLRLNELQHWNSQVAEIEFACSLNPQHLLP